MSPTSQRENEMLRTAIPWVGLCLWGAVLAYCFLVAVGP